MQIRSFSTFTKLLLQESDNYISILGPNETRGYFSRQNAYSTT